MPSHQLMPYSTVNAFNQLMAIKIEKKKKEKKWTYTPYTPHVTGSEEDTLTHSHTKGSCFIGHALGVRFFFVFVVAVVTNWISLADKSPIQVSIARCLSFVSNP